MPRLINNASKLIKLGEAMSDYGQMLDAATRGIKRILEDTDAELLRAMREAADGTDGWNLNPQENEYIAKRRAMVNALNDLNDAAKRYEAVKERIIHLIKNKSTNGDCQKAKASLEKLAEVLESYYGVQLLEVTVEEDASTQKVLVKRR